MSSAKNKKHFDLRAFCERMEEIIGDQESASRIFWKALSFAVDAHSGQKRKSGEAYVSHPCHVVSILIEELGITDPDTLAAAILHDTVEDVPEVTIPVISEIFDDKIARIVDGCTKISEFSGDRQTFYNLVHRKIFSGAADEVAVIIIKLADRLHNLRTMSSMPRHKRQKIAEETLAVYAPLALTMGLFGLKRELYNRALEFKFPRQCQKVLALIRQSQESEEAQDIRRQVAEAMERDRIPATVRVRARGLSAYYDGNRNILTHTADLPVQIIIVVDDVLSCYHALGAVDQLFPPIPRTIRDFIANPKPTGYQSLHAKANIKGRKYLFKIRTREMQRDARGGVVRAWLQQGEMPSGFHKEISEMFNILASDSNLSYRDIIAARGKKEIYTYTPKGDCICLPYGSIVLDFAFRIHTEIGRRCTAAMIGRRRVGPEHVLKDGDQVRILTSDKAVRFHPSILELCREPRARAEIGRLFRMRVDNLCREIGESLLQQELKRYGIPREVLQYEDIGELLAYYRLNSVEDLHRQIGKGRLRLPDPIYEIRHGLWAGRKTLHRPTGALNQIELTGLDPVSIKFSRCCNPLPVDHGLIGFFDERGLSVHRKGCNRLASLKFSREDVVTVRWNLKKTAVEMEQSLLLLRAPRNRFLMMLGAAPAQVEILAIDLLTTHGGQIGDWEVRFRVDNLFELRVFLLHCSNTGLQYEYGIER